MMALFYFFAYEKGFKFHVQPQTGAYSCCVMASTFLISEILVNHKEIL